MLSLVFTCILMLVALLVFSHYSTANLLADYESPLNMALLRAPKQTYSDQVVNLWIDKTWRKDGRRVPCRYERRNPQKQAKLLIIYSHGNAENLQDCIQFMRETCVALDCDMVSWDMSGYGLNEADKFERSAEGINLTLRTVVAAMQETYGYKPNEILLWGFSISTGPTLAIASESLEWKGVICVAPFTSILNVVRDMTNDTISQLFQERWDNVAAIQKVQSPILLIHGQFDQLVNVSHSETLKRTAPHAKLVILPKMGHATFNWTELWHQVKTWCAEIP